MEKASQKKLPMVWDPKDKDFNTPRNKHSRQWKKRLLKYQELEEFMEVFKVQVYWHGHGKEAWSLDMREIRADLESLVSLGKVYELPSKYNEKTLNTNTKSNVT